MAKGLTTTLSVLLLFTIFSFSSGQGNNITSILEFLRDKEEKNIVIAFYYSNNTDHEILFDSCEPSCVLLNAAKSFSIDSQLTWTPSAYIITTDDVSKYMSILQSLYLTWIWNPRALFIISLYEGEDASNYAEVSWKYGIMFLYIVTTKEIVFSYDLYNNGSCGNNINLQKIPKEHIFKRKLLPLRFNHCPLRILATKILPYVIDPYDKTNCGYEVKLVREIAAHADLEPIFVNHSYPHWGQKESNGSYSYMFADLYEGKADLMMGMVVAQSSWFSKEFEGTHMHGLEASHFFVPSAAVVDGWKNFTQVFSATVWITLLISVVVTSTAVYIASKSFEEKSQYNDIQNCIFTTLRMCLSPKLTHTTTRLRFIFTLWCASFLLINTAYQSQLISTLLKPAHEHQITSVEEVVYASNLKLGGFEGLVDFFTAAADDVYKDIKKNWINCTLSETCLNRTAKQRDFAVMKTVKTVVYHLQNMYRRPNGEYEVYKLEDYAFVYSICFALRRGSPYLERFNSLLLGLAENGLYNRWVDSIPSPFRKVHSDQMVQLNLHHLKLAFVLLLVGHASAAFVLFIECKINSKNSHTYIE